MNLKVSCVVFDNGLKSITMVAVPSFQGPNMEKASSSHLLLASGKGYPNYNYILTKIGQYLTIKTKVIAHLMEERIPCFWRCQNGVEETEQKESEDVNEKEAVKRE